MRRLTASCISRNLGGVTILAALNFLVGAYLVLMSFLAFWLGPFVAVYLCVTTFFLILGYGLWKLRNWARQAQIVLCMMGVVGCLLITTGVLRDGFDSEMILFFFGFTALNVAIILYLLRPQVKQAFGASKRVAEPLS